MHTSMSVNHELSVTERFINKCAKEFLSILILDPHEISPSLQLIQKLLRLLKYEVRLRYSRLNSD